MEDSCSYSEKKKGVLWRSFRDGDFEEEDVWAVPNEGKDSTFKAGQSIESSNIAVTRHLPSAARMITRSLSATSNVGTSCSTSTTLDDVIVKQQSAPVTIPDWSNACTIDDDDDEYNTKFPPHEIIARRLARSQISSFSVLEGIGRKLKGRDLRKVRNAVLTKTGFLE
ncbi:hypothetical protein V6N13_031653 [Hibiscus sabdariffa]|uniref:Senescence regulator n=1 Tax=Hibiscus sabdariffa TaxID=183260 RepID=A0ABR2CJP4_9ROSI